MQRDKCRRCTKVALNFNLMSQCGSTMTRVINVAASCYPLYGWRCSFACCGFLSIHIIPLSNFLNETPRFLTKKGRMDEAKVILGRIHRNGVKAELLDLVGLIGREGKGKWKRLSHSSLLVVNIVSQFLQRVIGLDSIVLCGPMFLQSIGYSYHASFLAPLIANVVRTGVAAVTYSSYTYFG